MENRVIIEGHVAKVGSISKSGKMMECLFAWNDRQIEGKERQTVFLPVWFYLTDENKNIAKGDWVLIVGRLLQRQKTNGEHRTYILGRLFVVRKKEPQPQYGAEFDLPPIPDDELPF